MDSAAHAVLGQGSIEVPLTELRRESLWDPQLTSLFLLLPWKFKICSPGAAVRETGLYPSQGEDAH